MNVRKLYNATDEAGKSPTGEEVPLDMPSSYQGPSYCQEFDDPDEFSAAIPGGRFGALPHDNKPFHAGVYQSNLGDGILLRSITTSGPIGIRSEFVGSPHTITFLIPLSSSSNTLFDGKEFLDGMLVTRITGDTPHLRSNGAQETGAIVAWGESLRYAASALTGKEHSSLLLTPGKLQRVQPSKFMHLKRTHMDITRLLGKSGITDIERIDPRRLKLLRGRLITAFIGTLTSGTMKHDHLATQLQTTSMTRIERFIDENANRPVGLVELCETTSLSLRTAETIVRKHTGMTVHGYFARRRLAFVREALLSPAEDTTIARVAMFYGFYHLGRFSEFYKRMYGEPPSRTLQRVRGERP